MTQSAKAPAAAIQHQFQAALLHVLRQPHSAQAQLALYDSARSLSQTLYHPNIETFWQVSSVFLEAQALSLLPARIQPQPLLVRLERQLQQHIQALEQHQTPQPDLTLLHELLLTLAQLEPRTPALKQLNFSWGLPSVARRITANMSLAKQQQALRQSLASLAHQHLSQLVQRLNTSPQAEQRLHNLCADTIRLLATLPLVESAQALTAIKDRLGNPSSLSEHTQRQHTLQQLNQIIQSLMDYRQTLSQGSSVETQPKPAVAAAPPKPEPIAAASPHPQNPLLRVLIQDGRQSIQLAQKWLQKPSSTEPLNHLSLSFSTLSDASHALGEEILSELANLLSKTLQTLQNVALDRLDTFDDQPLQNALELFQQNLDELEAGVQCTADLQGVHALTHLQESLAQQVAPPWDETTETLPTVSPATHETPPWSIDEADTAPANDIVPEAKPARVQPQQIIRLPAHWVETYVQMAQTGRKERTQMQAQLTDLDYQLEQLEADGAALLAEIDSHSGYGAVSKTLMASLRSVLSLSQSLQHSSQQTQTALQQQQQLQQRLQDQIEGWQSVPLGRLDYPLQQHIQQLEAATGRRIVLQLPDAEQTFDHSQLNAWLEPLKLIITHAAHHSFDSATARQELGKPEALQLSLTLSDAQAQLILTDDGQGIPLAPLMARARQQAVPAKALQSTPSKLLELIFHPQVAPTLEQEPLPGAGPELCSAHQHLQALGGALHLQSQVHVGTRYTLSFPSPAALATP